MRELVYVEEITYEDCGVLGGRSYVKSGTEFEVLEETNPLQMFEQIMFERLSNNQKGTSVYPFNRIGICGILIDGKIVIAATVSDSLETGNYKFQEKLTTVDEFDYSEIGTCFSAWDVQEYAILQEVDDGLFRGVGYKEPESEDKYGRVYDIFRCLDMRGVCNAPVVESNEAFHNYSRYEIGEDYFIEAIDNEVSNTREFWLCRDFGFTKHLITSYDPDDLNFRGLFWKDGKLMIDEQIAELILLLSDPHEFFFIDNDYNLSMLGMEMEGDEELFTEDEEQEE